MKNNKKNISITKVLDCPSKYVKCFYLFQSGKLFVQHDPRYTDSQTIELCMWRMCNNYIPRNHVASLIRNQVRRFIFDKKGSIIKVPFNIRRKYFPVNCGRKEYKLYIELK